MDQRGILGNSRLLVVEDNSASWLALFYPHVGQPQNLNVLRIGVLVDELKWLASKSSTVFEYVEGTGILRSKHIVEDVGVEVRDFVLPDDDVAIRRISVQNKSRRRIDAKLLVHEDLNLEKTSHREPSVYSIGVENILHSDGRLFFLFSGEPVFDRSICSQHEIDDPGSCRGRIFGWNLKGLRPGEKKDVRLIVVLGTSYEETSDRLKRVRAIPLVELEKECENFWKSWPRKSRIDGCLLPWMNRLLFRSSILLHMLMDHAGGIVASPDTRALRENGDPYTYVWWRDSAFTVMALDELGYYTSTRRFFDFAEQCQCPEGYFPEKCMLNGVAKEVWCRASSIQVDQTGLVVHSVWHHFTHSGDRDLLLRKWKMIESAAVFMDGFIGEDGLPMPSYDLWGEEKGVHIFSAVCIFAGLNSASNIAGILDKSEKEKIWHNSAENLCKTILDSMYDEEGGFFIRRLSPRDARVDASSLFTILFNMVDAGSEVARKTIKAVEDKLTVPGTLGVARFIEDDFRDKVNPWIVPTLWLADAYLMIGDLDRAEILARWCASQATTTGLLPEQIGRSTGKPVPPVPHTWSHAAYLWTALHLARALKDQHILV